jgi:hypothetical protein
VRLAIIGLVAACAHARPAQHAPLTNSGAVKLTRSPCPSAGTMDRVLAPLHPDVLACVPALLPSPGWYVLAIVKAPHEAVQIVRAAVTEDALLGQLLQDTDADRPWDGTLEAVDLDGDGVDELVETRLTRTQSLGEKVLLIYVLRAQDHFLDDVETFTLGTDNSVDIGNVNITEPTRCDSTVHIDHATRRIVRTGTIAEGPDSIDCLQPGDVELYRFDGDALRLEQ